MTSSPIHSRGTVTREEWLDVSPELAAEFMNIDGPWCRGALNMNEVWAILAGAQYDALFPVEAADVELSKKVGELKAGAADVGGWRPIETAPKDGTWVQAWRDPPGFTGGTWEPLVYVRWEDEEGAWVWPDEDYQVFTERGVELANMKVAEFENYASTDFTHWQPLPSPPLAEGQDLGPFPAQEQEIPSVSGDQTASNGEGGA